jgi:plasmid stabilization system protein ParE
MKRTAIAIASASVALTAFAQTDVEQIFHLTSPTAAVQDVNQIATMIRSIAEIKQVSVDPSLRNFSVRGTAEQIALARLDVQ